MLRMPSWRTLVVAAVCLFGVLALLPNFLSRATLDSMPGFMPTRQITLGLDLQGGSYLLLEVDMDAVIQDRLASLSDSARSLLRREQIGFSDVAVDEAGHVTAEIDFLGEGDEDRATGKLINFKKKD